jgi:hypothetical protein
MASGIRNGYKMKYRIINQEPGVWTTQMFFGSWKFLNQNAYFHENAGGTDRFASYKEAESIMFRAKEMNGEWHPEWL